MTQTTNKPTDAEMIAFCDDMLRLATGMNLDGEATQKIKIVTAIRDRLASLTPQVELLELERVDGRKFTVEIPPLQIPYMLDRIIHNQIALMEAASLARNWDDMKNHLRLSIEESWKILRRET